MPQKGLDCLNRAPRSSGESNTPRTWLNGPLRISLHSLQTGVSPSRAIQRMRFPFAIWRRWGSSCKRRAISLWSRRLLSSILLWS